VSRLAETVAPARLGRPFRWLLASSWVSNLGDGIALAAGPLLVASRTSDARLVALGATLQWLPPLLFGLLAGALADAGVDARVVAGPTGRHRLLEIAAMTAPSAVVLSSELPAPDLGMVAALAEQHPDLPVFAMVPDEAAALVPLGRQVHRVRTVPGLVHEVLAVCG